MRLILAACFLLMITPTFGGGLLFSQMEDGDKVQVTEKSTGCFHNTVSYYEVARSGDAYSFAVYKITWSDGPHPLKILKKEVVGKIPLSREDVKKLDGLLGFYREPKTALSTTEVSLVLEFLDTNGLVIVEKRKDESGGYGLENRKDLVTFSELVARFPKEGLEAAK